MSDQSLFQQIGGKDAVNAAVDIFYQRVLSDERTSRFFQGVDMELQRKKQKMFLTYVMGGAPNYPGDSMRKAHSRLVDMGLGDVQFNAVIEHLAGTLSDLGVSNEHISQIGAIAESVRGEVLNR